MQYPVDDKNINLMYNQITMGTLSVVMIRKLVLQTTSEVGLNWVPPYSCPCAKLN